MNSNDSNLTTVGARWIVPVDRPPLRDASITISDGLMQSINENGRAAADEDLGDVALTPMLVNAHTHLEFSSLLDPLGKPGNLITDWIPEVIAWRTQQTAEQIQTAIVSGLQESLAWGVDCLGEIATSPWYENIGPLNGDLQVAWFAEVLGGNPDDAEGKIRTARSWLDSPNQRNEPGISPHSPYSLCRELFEGLIEWANANEPPNKLPIAMHLAESPQEIEWLQSGTGPFVDLFDRLNIPAPARLHQQPIGFLEALATTSRALIVHGNYLSAKELQFIGQHSNLHLVYCPRTHAFFQHDPWPMELALKYGINVAVGTDSLASNPDLNLLAELKLIHQQYPAVSPERVFQMGTINGAKALGFEKELGSLTVGKQSDYLTFDLSSDSDTEDDLWLAILGE